MLDVTIKNYVKTLDLAERNKSLKIVGCVGAADGVTRRLLELGFTAGQRVKILATSIQKKVFLVEVRGYVLSVRASLLCRVQVE